LTNLIGTGKPDWRNQFLDVKAKKALEYTNSGTGKPEIPKLTFK